LSINSKWNKKEKEDYVKNILLRCAKDFVTPSATDTTSSASEEDDYFGFKNNSSSSQLGSILSLDMQVAAYLTDKDKNIKALDNHPLIKNMFMRYNTTIPSSAPVERLFSLAGMTLTPKRSSLSDKTFERLVFIRANKN